MITPHMAVAAARIRAIRYQGTFEIVPRTDPTPPVNPPSAAYQRQLAAIRNRVRSLAP